jgi:hypothetical protein
MRIQIITGEGNQLKPFYLLFRLAEIWQEGGHTVSIGAARQVDADLAIMHVDLTHVPVHSLPQNPCGRPVLNGRILDISKTRISRQRVWREDTCVGAVIVKSNLNAFGRNEFQALRGWGMPHLRRRLGKVVPWRWAGCLPKKDYPVLEDISKVPGWVWGRRDLIVERFVPEREGSEYVLRCWLFFGDKEYSVKLFSRHAVVKASNCHRHEYLHDVPDSLRETRHALGFDFGKFDYVMVDGEAVLLDVNKTPSISGSPRTPNLLRLATGLAGLAQGAPA